MVNGDQVATAARERAEAIRRRVQADLLHKANVVGVGVGLRRIQGRKTGEVALVVMVDHKVPRAQLAPEDVLPSQIDGIPVDVQEVGELEARPL
jgi:hypothetical protein